MKTPTSFKIRTMFFGAACATTIACCCTAAAADYQWSGSTSGAWDVQANWNGVTPLFNNQADVSFHSAGAANFNPTYLGGSDLTVRSIWFNANVSSPVSVQLDDNAGTGRTLTFQADSGSALLSVDAGASANISIGSSTAGSISLGSDLQISNASTATLTIERAMVEATGPFSVTKLGTGLLMLNSAQHANSYSAATMISEGTIKLGDSEQIPDFSPLVVEKGTLDLNGHTESLFGNGIAVTFGSTNATTAGTGASITSSAPGAVLNLLGDVLYYAGKDGANNGTATISSPVNLSGAARNFHVGDSDQTENEVVVSGIIGNSVGQVTLVKYGPGTLVLGSANTYGGGSGVNGGTLKMAANQAIAANAGKFVTVVNGTLDLNGKTQDLSVAPSLNLGAGATTTAGLTANVIDSAGGGLLQILGLAFNAGSVNANNGTATVSANLDLKDSLYPFFTINDSTNAVDLVISGSITNSAGTKGPIYTGLGTTVLAGRSSYNGGTSIARGTVRLGVDNAIPPTALAMGCGTGDTATFDLAGHTASVSDVYLANAFSWTINSRNQIIDSISGGALKVGGGVVYAAGQSGKNNGQTTVSASLDLNGTNRFFTIGDSDQTSTETVISGPIINSGATPAAVIKAGPGTLVLSAPNTYNGGTVVNAGALLMTGNGSAVNSPYFTVGSGALFDVSAVTGGFTLGGGQLISGHGSVCGPVLADGMVIPGATGSAGVLSFTNHLQFGAGGVASLDVGKNSGVLTNDLIEVFAGSLSYGGALSVSLLPASEPLAVNDTFTLFRSTGGLVGGFSSTNLPAGYIWDTSFLNAGEIRVAAIAPLVPTTPTNITVAISGNLITLSWPSNYVGWSLQAQTNSLSVGLSANWVTVEGSAAVSTMSFPLEPNNAAVFYRLFYQAP